MTAPLVLPDRCPSWSELAGDGNVQCVGSFNHEGSHHHPSLDIEWDDVSLDELLAAGAVWLTEEGPDAVG